MAVFAPLFIIVVELDVFELLLLLLTERLAGGAFSMTRFGLAAGGFDFAVELLALRVVVPFARAGAGFDFSFTTFTKVAVATAGAPFAGESGLIITIGFNGDAGRERLDFGCKLAAVCIGECGRVREFDDLGDNTVDGLGA